MEMEMAADLETALFPSFHTIRSPRTASPNSQKQTDNEEQEGVPVQSRGRKIKKRKSIKTCVWGGVAFPCCIPLILPKSLQILHQCHAMLPVGKKLNKSTYWT